MELIDLLFWFWCALAVGVCGLGSLYEKQLEAKKKEKLERDRRRASNFLASDRWNQEQAPSSSSYLDQSYNKSNYSNNYDSYNNNSSNNNVFNQSSTHHQATSDGIYNQTGDYYNQSRFQSTQQSSPYGLANQQHYEPSQKFDRNNFDNIVRNSYGAQDYSMSPSQMERLAQSSHPISQLDINAIPTATGFNNDCVEWVNSILYLFFTQPNKYAPQIAENLCRSMNEKLANITSSSAEYSDLIIEFTGINRELSSRPELTNIRTEMESDKSVSANCKLYIQRIVLDLTVQRTRIGANQALMSSSVYQDQPATTKYEITLENVEGKLKTMAMLNDKLIVIQFMEKPDMKIMLRAKYSSAGGGQVCPINEDILVQMILQTLTQVVVDLYFGDDVDFPHYKGHHSTASTLQNAYRNKLNALKGSASEIKRHIKQDFFGALSSDHKERKVFIKILRAKNINYNQNVTCLLELDNPYQQALTSTQHGSNPYWDEHFLLNATDKSSELTLELWDSITNSSAPQVDQSNQQHKRTKSMSGGVGASHLTQPGQVRNAKNKWNKAELTGNAKFLGLARVNIDDLRKNPVQKCSLTLQSSANKTESGEPHAGSNMIVGSDLTSNSFGGELQVELLFLEHSSSSAASGQNSGSALQKSGSANSLAHLHQVGDVVSVDRKLTPSGYVITTTTITKPVGSSRHKSRAEQLHEQLHLTLPRNPSPSTTEPSEMDHYDGISSARLTDVPTPTTDLDASLADHASQGRGRSRSRSRSLLRAIKKRFSFSRTRSRSVGESLGGPGSGSGRDWSQPGTAQLDRLSIGSRSRASSEVSASGGGRAKSVPASRDPNEVPVIVINKGRLSDTASAFTFTHPKSQLVIECSEPKMNEDGSTSSTKSRLRYYAISDDAANKRKWRKRGIKLHLLNEHQFVACHLAGSSTCHLCGRVFSRRPGKQGYKCRNCHLLSHKECHVKVDHNCPYASKDGLRLEYIDADPPSSLVLDQEMAEARSSGSGLNNRSLRMGAKSISVDMDDR